MALLPVQVLSPSSFRPRILQALQQRRRAKCLSPSILPSPSRRPLCRTAREDCALFRHDGSERRPSTVHRKNHRKHLSPRHHHYTLPSTVSLSTWVVAPRRTGLYQFTMQVSDPSTRQIPFSESFQFRISDQLAVSGPAFTQILYNTKALFSDFSRHWRRLPPYTWA